MSKRPCPECGKPMDRQSRRCLLCSNYGRKRSIMKHGYVRVWVPGHPMAQRDGYALEHRRVLYDAGVEIPTGSHVHHINEDRTDNRIENLLVLTPREHIRDHAERNGVVNQYGVWPLRN